MMKKRLDLVLLERNLAKTQIKAQAYIMAGQVFVSGKIIDKPGTLIRKEAEVVIREKFPYVSRGALKIEKAYCEFELDFNDKTVCDIGSSTGGFTDFVLQHGASKVFAIDVGRGQLDQKLREDDRVVVMEKTDFRDIDKLPGDIDYFLGDLSFISLRKILPQIKRLIVMSQQSEVNIVVLIKPQFEASRKEVTQGKGVIKSEQTRLEITEEIKTFAQNIGFTPLGLVESPITGAKGNKEYLLWLKL